MLDMEVIIGGTPALPIVEGNASIKNGSFESLNSGAVLSDIELSLIGNDKKLILESFSGHDGLGGKVTATGHILLDVRHLFRARCRHRQSDLDAP